MQSMKLLASAALAWGVLIGSVSGQDDCNAPLALTVNTPQTFSLAGATSDGNAGCVAGMGAVEDIWFSFTPGVTGCHRVGLGAFTAGSAAQIDVAWYLASTCPLDSDLIDCGSGAGATIEIDLTAGVTYLIRLAGTAGDASICVQGPESAGGDMIEVDGPTSVFEGASLTMTVTPTFSQATQAFSYVVTYDPTKVMWQSNSETEAISGRWYSPDFPLVNFNAITHNAGLARVEVIFAGFTNANAMTLPSEVHSFDMVFQLLGAAVDGDILPFTIMELSPEPSANYVSQCTIAVLPTLVDASVSVVAAPVCAAPANLTATTGLGGVTLAWDANMDHTDFVIERNGVQIATPGMGTTMFVDSTPVPGISDYTVTAMCGGDMASAMVMSGQVAIYSAGTDADPMTGLPVFLEFVDGTVSGGTFGLRHNSMNLTPTGHTLSAALMMLNGNTGPEFENFQMDGTEGVTYAFVTDFGADMMAPDVLSPAGPIELIRVQYSVPLGATPGTEPVMFAGDLTPGGVPLPIPVAVTFTPTAGTATQLPATAIDGSVLIAGFFIRGDVNGDDLVQLVDAIRLLEVLFLMGVNPMCDDALDASDDGVVGILDAIVILQYLFGGGAAPAAPFPDCGLDPTPDMIDCIVDTGTC